MTKKQTIKYYIWLAVGVIIFWLITLTPINIFDEGFFLQLIILSVLILVPQILRVRRDKSRGGATADEPLEEEGRVFEERQQGPFKVYRRKHAQPQFKNYFGEFKDLLKRLRLLWIPVGLLVLYIILQLTSAPLFRAKSYAALIDKQQGDFKADISEIAIDEIPLIDRDTSIRLGNKKMGELPELVSQFEVAPDYTQINFQNRPVRVTPLKYDDLIKWFTNRSEGLPRIVRIDMNTGEVTLQKLPSGMKYSESEPLFRNIRRHLRLRYPLDILDRSVLEIDEEGIPYWITPVVKPQVGWFKGRDVKQVIICNALTGETEKFDIGEIPEWIDRVYPSEMIIKQLDDNGKFQSGWFNSVLGQKGVLQTTSGYNYLALNDDVYLYTGITPVTEDSSNLGFVLVNLRTKDTRFYPVASADEYSAMRSAEGAVQEKGYISTFPLLLNIKGRPTYCMALKDSAQLVKMYALVDAQDYQTTATGPSLRTAVQNYEIALTVKSPVTEGEEIPADQLTDETVTIDAVQNVVLEGNTFYYMQFKEHPDRVFTASLQTADFLPFLKQGDKIVIHYVPTEFAESLQQIERIERAK